VYSRACERWLFVWWENGGDFDLRIDLMHECGKRFHDVRTEGEVIVRIGFTAPVHSFLYHVVKPAVERKI